MKIVMTGHLDQFSDLPPGQRQRRRIFPKDP